jgi:hypoxanthine phosphoribosyltransferase
MNDLSLSLLISEEEIQKKVLAIAKHIRQDYEGKEILIIMILKGALCFVADLIRNLPSELFTLECIRCKSYGLQGMQRTRVVIEGLEGIEIQGKHILLIDDIFDSGETLSAVVTQIQEKVPASLKTLVLLSKQIARQVSFEPDHALMKIHDEFVVGYGLDYREYYRGLKDIYKITLGRPQ